MRPADRSKERYGERLSACVNHERHALCFVIPVRFEKQVLGHALPHEGFRAAGQLVLEPDLADEPAEHVRAEGVVALACEQIAELQSYARLFHLECDPVIQGENEAMEQIHLHRMLRQRSGGGLWTHRNAERGKLWPSGRGCFFHDALSDTEVARK